VFIIYQIHYSVFFLVIKLFVILETKILKAFNELQVRYLVDVDFLSVTNITALANLHGELSTITDLIDSLRITAVLKHIRNTAIISQS
jgi:hypothetical protein